MHRKEGRGALAATVVSFIVGLTVILSIDWSFPANGPMFESAIFALGIALAVVVGLALMFIRHAGRGPCPSCGRPTPRDAAFCPSC
ncbi:MAG: hypothetical protein ACT4OI_06265, partial [Methanobacteriota archaeon]